MRISPHSHQNYREYILQAIENRGEKGIRGKLAKAIKCQPSFLSQVLSGRTDLSLEHALKASAFFKHSKKEKDYFMLMVQKEKAGTSELKSFFQSKMESHLESRDEVKEAVSFDSNLSASDYSEYYSSWWYAAIHVATALPEVRTIEDVSNTLNLPFERVESAIDFLQQRGLVQWDENDNLQIGKNRIHIGRESPLVHSHHRNWRMKCSEDLSKYSSDDLHFTGVLALSKQDNEKLRLMLLELIKKTETLVRETEDEELVVFLLDQYKL